MSRVLPKSSSELEQAEKKYREKLEMEKQKGSKEGMAVAYSNLGTIYLTIGHLNEAEEMFQKCLELEEELVDKEGMASNYG
jgi:protein O-GlcNAc transferase